MTQAAIEIALESRPLERIPADVAVAGVFADDRPLRGGVARMDWRLCGMISALVASGRFEAARGEALLVPTEGALRAPRALILGLGTRAGFALSAAQDAMRDAAARSIALGARRVAMAPVGVAPDDVPRHAVALVGGAVEAARTARGDLALVLTVPAAQHDAVVGSLERAIRAVAPGPVSLRAEPRPRPAGESRGGPSAHL